MGTRSTIALEFADGTVQQVYCHWDGYLSHNGEILRDHYSDPFKLAELISIGDLSSLAPSIDKPAGHSFDSPVDGHTVFYGRDRGESGCNARKFKNLQDYFRNCQDEEYDYILTRNTGWRVRCYATDGDWVALGEMFEREAAEDAA